MANQPDSTPKRGHPDDRKAAAAYARELRALGATNMAAYWGGENLLVRLTSARKWDAARIPVDRAEISESFLQRVDACPKRDLPQFDASSPQYKAVQGEEQRQAALNGSWL